MKTWAIVPVKPLNRAKSRLSGILTPPERRQLTLRMLRYNLETVSGMEHLSGVLVISRDTNALQAAQGIGGVLTLQENGVPHLNGALNHARKLLLTWGVEAILVLPADLPLLAADDLRAMLEMGHQPGSVVIAPDRHGQGTNAIFLHPPGIIDFSFGAGSFGRHQAEAQIKGARILTYQSERLALDIDTPDDLHLWQEFAPRTS
jgi:2-phospho-L-lactate guanylyltransferase